MTSAPRARRSFAARCMLVLTATLTTMFVVPPAHASEDPTWVPTLPLANQGRSILSPLSDGSIILSHNHGFGVPPLLLRSHDDGTTWNSMPLPPEAQFSTTRFATPKLGYSTGRESVYVSRDAGGTWKDAAPLPSDGGPPAVYGIGVLPASNVAYAFGGAYGPLQVGCNTPDETIWTTRNGGRRWSRFSFGSERQPFSVTAFDSKRGLALVHNMADVANPCEQITQPTSTSAWLTTDGGKQWREVHECRTYCTSAAYVSRSRILLGHNDGSITYSSDGGRRWRRGQTLRLTPDVSTPVDDGYWVQAMDFVKGRVGYASTKGGATWRTDDGGIHWELELSHEAVYPGLISGDVAALDAQRAVIAGPTAVAVRRLLP